MADSKKIVVEFEPSDLFQIHLSLVSRSAFVTQMWASCTDAKVQKAYEVEIKYLNEIAAKVMGILGGSK